MQLRDLRHIARIAMARCTQEAKFEAVQRHYSFILYLPYIQNFTMQGWNNEIKEKVNGEET